MPRRHSDGRAHRVLTAQSRAPYHVPIARRAVAIAADDLFDLFISSVQDYAIFMLDDRGNVATWNVGAERIEGYPAEDVIGRPYSIFYSTEDVAAGKPGRELATAAADGRLEEEGWRVRGDGTRFWANVVLAALRDHSGVLRGFSRITRDLTERRLAHSRFRASEERFRLMVDAAQDYAILMLDVEGFVTTWNLGAERIKGYRAHEIIGRHFSVFYSADDIAADKPRLALAHAASEGRAEDEGWRVRRDGTRFWANVVISALRAPDGTLRGYGKITRDLTQSRENERRLEHIADHDPLTGVPNRRHFGRELGSHIARVARYGPTGAVLMVDLDNFKSFNDTQGHGAGDELMVRIAQGLQARLRESDVFARLGGDEFAVLLPFGGEREARIVAEALIVMVRDEPMRARIGAPPRLTASVGIALFADGERLNAAEMMSHADAAMYGAKAAGRNRWARYGASEPSVAPAFPTTNIA